MISVNLRTGRLRTDAVAQKIMIPPTPRLRRLVSVTRGGCPTPALERLQGQASPPPRVTLTSLRKLYDLLGDGITCRTDDPVRMLTAYHRGVLP